MRLVGLWREGLGEVGLLGVGSRGLSRLCKIKHGVLQYVESCHDSLFERSTVGTSGSHS